MTGSAEDTASGSTPQEPNPVAGSTVLVVDDEETVIESFRFSLDDAGHEVVTATNGGEALVELGPEIDVVLLDRRMPGMSGDEVLDHIQEWRTDCRVVMVTAVDPDTDIVDMAFDDYLTKPVSGSELVRTVNQLLLFDRYEALLAEYHALTRKYATLRGALDDREFRDSDEIGDLEARRESVRADLTETIEAFVDEDVRSVLESAHGELP